MLLDQDRPDVTSIHTVGILSNDLVNEFDESLLGKLPSHVAPIDLPTGMILILLSQDAS